MIKLFFLLTLARSVNCLACYDSGGNYVACFACPAGEYYYNSMCNQCDWGTFKAESSYAWSCSPCPPGTYTLSRGTIQCSACSTSICDPTSGRRITPECDQADYGTLFFPQGNLCGTTKTAGRCFAGRFYKDFPNKQGCNYLNEDLYSIQDCPASRGCQVCPQGTIQPSSAKCLDCPIGTHSPYLGSWREECTQCPATYSCPSVAMAYPIPCPLGTYSYVGATSCLPCITIQANGYISGNGASETGCAFKCNAGFYKTSTPSCDQCSFGSSSTKDLADGSVCPPCLYASISGAACSVGFYPSFSSTTCAVTKCTACSNLPASGKYYSTTASTSYYSTASITTEASTHTHTSEILM